MSDPALPCSRPRLAPGIPATPPPAARPEVCPRPPRGSLELPAVADKAKRIPSQPFLWAVMSRNRGRGKFSRHHWLSASCASFGCGSVRSVMHNPPPVSALV